MKHLDRVHILLVALAFLGINVQGQAPLVSGYDTQEAIEMLKVCVSFVDSPMAGMNIPPSERFHRIYRSPVMGMDNRWELHSDGNGQVVISLRGTTTKRVSWLENGYAAMVAARGRLRLEPDFVFEYKLSEDDRAAVHVGWLIGMAYLQRDILPRIDSAYAAGVRDVLVAGHSQGGALAYLLTAHLHALRAQGRIGADLRFKTYASAAPKPGNLFFAHHYEHITAGGWAFNTINAWDWVPEVPMSIQTVNDFNTVNPFTDAKKAMRSLPLVQRIVLRGVYNKLDRPARRAQRNYQRYLGRTLSRYVRKSLPGYEPPVYAPTNLYARTGAIVTMMPDTAYAERFPQAKEELFVNHMLEPYLYLAERMTTRP